MGFELEILEGKTVYVCERERETERGIKIYLEVTYKTFTVFRDVAFFFHINRLLQGLKLYTHHSKKKTKNIPLHSQFTHEAT